MVGHLVHGRAQAARIRQQVTLGVLLDVAGEQRGPTPPPGTQDHRHLVGLAVAPGVGPVGRRVQHLEHELTDGGALAGDRARTGHAQACGGAVQRVGPGIAGDGGRPQGCDVSGVEDGRGAADVVCVRVGDDQEVQGPTSGRAQPVRGLVVDPCVHQYARPWSLEQDRITLADVDGGQHEVPWSKGRDTRNCQRERAEQGHDRAATRGPGARPYHHPHADADRYHDRGRP
ncbi:MAG TPA: hypothetical protein VGA69_06305 [Nitriliruptorales bacterium]